MDTKLSSNVVVVTGGASGIGAATADAFSQESAIGFVIDKDVDTGASWASKLDAAGRKGHFVAADLTEEGGCER